MKNDGKSRDQLITELRSAYEGGASIRSLVASTGHSYGSIHTMLRESGTTMRIKGRGFAKKGGERGDQLVTLQIRLPSDLGKLAALAEALPDDPSLRAELGV